MTLLNNRIQRSERAIAEAKAEGRDVYAEWESHLEALKQALKKSGVDIDPETLLPVCWNCGATMTPTKDLSGREWLACWACAKTA